MSPINDPECATAAMKGGRPRSTQHTSHSTHHITGTLHITYQKITHHKSPIKKSHIAAFREPYDRRSPQWTCRSFMGDLVDSITRSFTPARSRKLNNPRWLTLGRHTGESSNDKWKNTKSTLQPPSVRPCRTHGLIRLTPPTQTHPATTPLPKGTMRSSGAQEKKNLSSKQATHVTATLTVPRLGPRGACQTR